MDQTRLTLWEKNGERHVNEARTNGTKTVRAADQCDATDAITTGWSTTADARHVMSIHAPKSSAKNQTMLAVVEKFTKTRLNHRQC